MDENRIISLFEEFMRNSRSKPCDHIIINADGKLHRFRIDGDRAGTKNGAYRLHTDGQPNGYVMNWKDGFDNRELWIYGFTDDERREYARSQNDPVQNAKIEQERKARERRKIEERKRQEENRQKAISQALAEYRHSQVFCHETGLIQHPYWGDKFGTLEELYITYLRLNLSTNRFPICRVTTPYNSGLCRTGELLVPMVSIATGEFQSLIHIPMNSDDKGKFSKPIYLGTSQTGSGHWLIPDGMTWPDVILVAEGITTAIAVAILTDGKSPVISCASCGNLKAVCEGLRKRDAKKKIIIMADNDEAGLKHSNECLVLGLVDDVKAPPEQGWDWYDHVYNEFRANYE